jgi:hypothetical protein
MVFGDNVLTFASYTKRHHAAGGHARNAELSPAVGAERKCW